jgi:hypothetical protein
MATASSPLKSKSPKIPASKRASLWRLQKAKLAELWQASAGNPRRLILTVPTGWTLLYAFNLAYLPLFLVQRGLTEVQVGQYSSLSAAVAMACMALSSVLAGRVHPVRLLVFGDLVAFGLAPLLLVFGHGLPVFALAAVFSGAWGLNASAMPLLLTEGVALEHKPKIFAVTMAAQLLPGFCSPLAGLAVKSFGLLPVGKFALGFGDLAATATCLYRLMALKDLETPAPSRTLGQQLALPFTLFRGERPALVLLLALSSLAALATGMAAAYASLYYVRANGLALPAAAISVFPVLGSVASLVYSFWAAPHFGQSKAGPLLRLAFLSSALSLCLVSFAPAHGFAWICVATLLAGMGTITASSVARSSALHLSSDEHRASLAPAWMFLTTLALVPAGALGGWLFSLHPRAPFMAAAGILAVVFLVSLKLDLKGENGETI